MSARSQQRFARALLDPAMPPPPGLLGPPERRFAVYRNNVAAGLIGALESSFPATLAAVGQDFFRAMAWAFAQRHPPRSPVMMHYGEEHPAFIAGFAPAAAIPYLADLAALELARLRSYHAADTPRLAAEAWAAVPPEALAGLRVALHPAVAVCRSPHPVLTIWAMNAGELEPAAIADWQPQDVLLDRPALDVLLRPLPPGGAVFLQHLAAGGTMADAADAAARDDAVFDLATSLATLIGGRLATAITVGTENIR